MGKFESLDRIKKIWDSNKSFEDVVLGISEVYYANGLDLASVAAYINATPSELDAILRLSELDEELIKRISNSNPPKTTWTIFASASEDEIKRTIDEPDALNWNDDDNTSVLRNRLVRAAEPTIQDKVSALSGTVIEAMYNKGLAYKALDDWQSHFLKNMSSWRKFGKKMTNPQTEKLIEILTGLVNNKVITRDCIDDDAEYCNIVLDALGK